MEKCGIRGFLVSQNGQDFIIGKAKIQDVLQYTLIPQHFDLTLFISS